MFFHLLCIFSVVLCELICKYLIHRVSQRLCGELQRSINSFSFTIYTFQTASKKILITNMIDLTTQRITKCFSGSYIVI